MSPISGDPEDARNKFRLVGKDSASTDLEQGAPSEGPDAQRALDAALSQNLSFDSVRDPETGIVSISGARALIEGERELVRRVLETRRAAGAESLSTVEAGGFAPSVQNSIDGVSGVGGGGFYGGGDSDRRRERDSIYQHHRDSRVLWSATKSSLDEAERELRRAGAEQALIQNDLGHLANFALRLQASGAAIPKIREFIGRAAEKIVEVRLGNGGTTPEGEAIGADWKVVGIGLTSIRPDAEVKIALNRPR